ncbi:Panacea domain-containing protein, partial [Listeria monocytogenes]
MKDVTLFARYLIHSYESYSRSLFENSEMKLQKLIYLAQRQSIALTGEILFQNDIQGWKHGPVVPE